jgi:hypothetical protein
LLNVAQRLSGTPAWPKFDSSLYSLAFNATGINIAQAYEAYVCDFWDSYVVVASLPHTSTAAERSVIYNKHRQFVIVSLLVVVV